jgi:hypothetical protein
VNGGGFPWFKLGLIRDHSFPSNGWEECNCAFCGWMGESDW